MLNMISAVISFSFMVIPVILIALTLRWLRLLHINIEKQTKQNEEIIALLTERNKRAD